MSRGNEYTTNKGRVVRAKPGECVSMDAGEWIDFTPKKVCDDCRWWAECTELHGERVERKHYCDRFYHLDSLAKSATAVHTRHNFGCNQWEAK